MGGREDAGSTGGGGSGGGAAEALLDSELLLCDAKRFLILASLLLVPPTASSWTSWGPSPSFFSAIFCLILFSIGRWTVSPSPPAVGAEGDAGATGIGGADSGTEWEGVRIGDTEPEEGVEPLDPAATPRFLVKIGLPILFGERRGDWVRFTAGGGGATRDSFLPDDLAVGDSGLNSVTWFSFTRLSSSVAVLSSSLLLASPLVGISSSI